MTWADEDVAVVGVGTIGAGVAGACALAGLRVTILSRHRERAREAVGRVLVAANRWGLADAGTTSRARESLSYVETPERIPSAVTLVLDNLPESLGVKVEVLGSVLRHLGDDAVAATNTSSLRVSDIGRGIGADSRTAGLHFMNPALLMPLVELVAGNETLPEVLDRCEQLARRLGKSVIHVLGDSPGFVWNRLQMALLREAVQLVADGVASREDVDTAVALGLARRWQFTGPLATARLGGAETFRAVARNTLPGCSSRRELDDLEEFLPSLSTTSAAAETRDEGLARLLRDAATIEHGE